MAFYEELWFAVAAWGMAAAVLPYLLYLFGRDRPVSTLRETPETAAVFLGWHLRSFGNLVEETKGDAGWGPAFIREARARFEAAGGARQEKRPPQGTRTYTVELGRYAAVRVRMAKEGDKTTIQWRPALTMRGWGAVTWLMVLGFVLPLIAVWISSRAARKGQAFVTAHVKSQIGPDGRAPPPPDELQYLLLRSLSDASRLATTAHESAKARYSDLRAIVAMIAMGIWLAFVLVNIVGAYPGGPTALAFYGTTVGAIAFGVGGWLFIRARYLPSIRSSGAWGERLRRSVAQVVHPPSDPAGGRSLVEELAEAASEVSNWEDMVARARWQRDPVGYWVVFSLAYAALVSAIGVPAAVGTLGTPAGLAVAASGGVLLFIAWWLARRSKEGDEDRRDAQRRSWESTRAELERRFDEFIGGSQG